MIYEVSHVTNLQKQRNNKIKRLYLNSKCLQLYITRLHVVRRYFKVLNHTFANYVKTICLSYILEVLTIMRKSCRLYYLTFQL